MPIRFAVLPFCAESVPDVTPKVAAPSTQSTTTTTTTAGSGGATALTTSEPPAPAEVKLLTPGKIGYHGVVNSSDRELIQSLWSHPSMVKQVSACRAKQQASNEPKVYWINMYLRPKWMDGMSEGEVSRAWDLGARLMDRVGLYSAAKEFVLNIGFLINPRGTTTAQPWHVDYSYSNSTIFVPITTVSDLNMTQYLEVESIRDSDLDDGWGYPAGLTAALSHNPFVKVVQVIAPPFSVVHMPPITIHRGIPNRADYDRVMFFVTSDKIAVDVQEGAFTDGGDSATNYDAALAAATAADAAAAAAAAATTTTTTTANANTTTTAPPPPTTATSNVAK